LVSWWPGEGNANDIVGTNSGTLQSGVSFSAAEVGQGFVFTSDGDGIAVPYNSNLDVQSPGFTVGLWIKGTKTQTSPDGMSTVLEKSHGWTDPTGWAFQIGSLGVLPNDGLARFYLSDGTFSDILGSVDVLDGNFHYLTATWDGSVTRFYVDAVLQGTAFNPAPANNTRGLNIGFTWGGGVPKRFFSGVVDEVEIYRVALSSSDIQSIFNAGGAGNCRFFNFTGFFQPVDNSPVVNLAKAGSAIPIEFSLNGNQGLAIFIPGFPGSQNQTCTGSATDVIEQTVTANASGLTYDPLSDQYTYVWKTSKAWAGTCRKFTLGLIDGSIHEALFSFK